MRIVHRLKRVLKNSNRYRQIPVLLSLSLLLTGCTAGPTAETTEQENQEDVVLSAFVQQSVADDSGIWSGWGADKLYEDTGIMLDFAPTGVAVEQKLKQYIAAGTLPDIIGFRDLDQAQMAMDAGLLLPLNQYEDLLPSLFETDYYKEAVAYSRQYNSNKTGRLYIMPCSIGPSAYNAYNWMPMLQWDMYKTIGMPQIDTLEDYLDVVEQMVEAKPYTETGEKVYGFSLFTDWDKYSALEVAALSFFYGIDTEYVSPLMEANVTTHEVNSILEEDSFYKRALEFYFQANQRGLLDPDSRTQSYNSIVDKYSQGQIMFSWFSWLTGSYNELNSGHVNNEAKVDGYASVPATDMKIYEAPDQTIGRNWYFAISNNCQSVEKACEFLNWLYDPQVEQYLYNGPEGLLWEYNEDGEPAVKEDAWDIIDNSQENLMPEEVGGGAFQDAILPFNAVGLQAATIMDNEYTVSYRYWPDSLSKDETLLQKEISAKLGTDTIAEYLYDNDMVAKSTMAVNMIPTLPDHIQTTVAAIGEIVRNLSWEMIYAKDQEQFQQLWQSMQSQAEELGLPQVISYYEKAWRSALKTAETYERG